MANTITLVPFNNPTNGFVSATSRYADSQLIYYGDLHKMTYTTYKKNQTRLTDNDKYTIISPGWEYRPDLVSKNIYGTPDFWWKILEANDMKDIWEFKSGVNIRLPVDVYGI